MKVAQRIEAIVLSALAPALAWAAFVSADGALSVAGIGRASRGTLLEPASMRAHAPDAAFHSTSASAIFARNPFDSVTGPLDKVHAPAEADPEAEAPPCAGIKVLAIAASADPDWSLAALRADGDTRSILRRRGGTIGDETVMFVGWDRVWMKRGERLCQSTMFREPDAEVAADAGATKATPPPDDPLRGIQRTSPTEARIDRGVVDYVIEHQAELFRGVKIVPELVDGRVAGVRISGLRPDAVLGRLGVENGDRLETINGFDLTKPDTALEAYARLRTAPHLTLHVTRGGKPVNLDLDVR